jgi:hypothetical protein
MPGSRVCVVRLRSMATSGYRMRSYYVSGAFLSHADPG